MIECVKYYNKTSINKRSPNLRVSDNLEIFFLF
nr:MAG TPA: hypothetical protein [Caudoviricetes sp.]